MAVGPMDKPTGPTGILKSNRPTPKVGGKKTMGGTRGLTNSPAAKMPGRKISR
jgi:hypothetical protein